MNKNHFFMNEDSIQIHESTLDLLCEHESVQLAEEFALEIEQKAADLEVTVDYYMQEFM